MTATVLENIATRIERLVLNGEDPEIILDELKLILISVNSGTSLPRLDFLFSAFAVQDEDVVNTLCSIIETVFSKLSLSETLVYPEILLGLNSTITRLQILAIKAILNPLQNKRFDQDSVLRLANDPIFDALLSCLGSIDTGVSENSTRTILKLASFKDVLEALLSTKKLTILEDIKAISPTCNLRVLDLMVSICTRQEITKIVVESGLLDDLVNGLKSSDLVAVLNRIEILSRISESSIGIEFLTSVGTFELFNSEMKNSDDLDLDVMLKKCSILKFYSNLAITNVYLFNLVYWF